MADRMEVVILPKEAIHSRVVYTNGVFRVTIPIDDVRDLGLEPGDEVRFKFLEIVKRRKKNGDGNNGEAC